MEKSRSTNQTRVHLDIRFRDLGPAHRYTVPARGWIKAIREGLGMTTAQLAKRLGIKQPSVVELEQSEARGSIELATLRRVAAALDCTVVYALVPNQPLQTMVHKRAELFDRKRRAPIEHSMLLEDQAVPPAAAADAAAEAARIEEIVRDTNPRLFWDD